MRDIRKTLALLSQQCYDRYGGKKDDFTFDHQISVLDGETFAMGVLWKRVEPTTIGDGRRTTWYNRFQFKLFAIHENVFDLYLFVDAFLKMLRDGGFAPGVPTGDTENLEQGRVEIDIVAIYEGG